MIITQDKNKQVVQSHDFDAVNCTIDAEDMRYVASLLRNNYSNPPLAVVREISANALDANMEASASRNVEVTVPSSLNPNFRVRDFGGGLSQEDIFGLYSKYGKSTKRDSNNYIGAFGIGKFAPLSYGNNFTVVSYHGGKKISYNIFVNEDDDTRIVKLDEKSSSEPTGLSVEVAIADDDVDTFREVVKNFFRFFSDDELPKFIGIAEDEKFFDEFDIVMEGKDKSWKILDDKQDYWHRNHRESHAVMGRVHYPINTDAINFDSIVVEGDANSERDARNLRDLASQDNIYIRFDIGQLKLHHSRESLEYNKNTQKEIISVLQRVRKDIEEIAKEKLGEAEDLWDAKMKYAQVVNALPNGLKNIFENSFEYAGIKIDRPDLQRNYTFQDNVIITEYWKQNDNDATDGYKVRSQKSTRIFCHKNTILAFQGNKTHHGNNLRCRTLFEENEELEKVVAVYWDDQKGKDHVYDIDEGMGFSKINEERIINLQDIVKAKLQSKGRAISGESRGDVPLFELDTSGQNTWKHTNSSHWLNCTENVEELEEGEGELVYVPIVNYKVVEENTTGQEEVIQLDSLLRDVTGIYNIKKGIHKSEDFDFPMVIGVRRKDCKSLDKTRWVEWGEYKKNFAKQYLLDNHEKVVESEKARAFKESHVTMSDYNKLDCLVENSKLRKIIRKNLTDKNHVLIQVLDDLSLMRSEDADLCTIFRLVNFLKREEKEWIEENVPSTYNPNDFNNKCKEICKKYPLLVNINNEVYNWQEMGKTNGNNFGANIMHYVTLCDSMGVGE